MLELSFEVLAKYVRDAFDGAELLDAGDIGSLDEQGMKGFGYGKPVRLRFKRNGQVEEAVLSVMKGDKYGHQYYWDRAHVLLFQYETSARLERHVRPLGVGYVNQGGNLVPLDGPQEFFIVNEKLEGYDYFLDLDRIRGGDFRDSDVEMARELARWLARIHRNKKDEPDLYYRRIRNLIGADECIYGLIDEAFPSPFEFFSAECFRALEKRIVDWRWRLKNMTHRLSTVHGDFHPWNVLVDGEGGFRVLDRSRGEWGEPAGDVATMAINYLLFGLYDKPRLSGPFETLYKAYFEEYLEQSGDEEVLEAIAPFFVFRCLVIASPEWYPDHPPQVRKGLLSFLVNVLEDSRFDWKNVNKYMK